MSESPNLPAVRTEPTAAVVRRDTDSWADQLPAIVDLARSVCLTDFVPESLRDNVAATAAAIMYGREVGLPPMTALSNVNVIKGKPGLSAVIMRAQVLAAGHEMRQDESNSALCKMSGRRRGTDYWQTVTYTIDDAKLAGHLRNEQYTKNPRRMLRARATSELCELMFADVVRGMPSLEELEDLDDDTPAGSPAKTTRATVQRKSRAKTDDGAVPPADPSAAGGPAAASSSPPLPPLPGEPGFDDTTDGAVGGEPASAEGSRTVGPAEEEEVPVAPPLPPEGDLPPEVEHEDRPRMINRGVQNAMHAAFNKLNITDRAERLHITSSIIGRTPMDHKTGEPSSNGLTMAEASTLLDALAHCKTRDHVEALIELAEQQREAGMTNTTHALILREENGNPRLKFASTTPSYSKGNGVILQITQGSDSFPLEELDRYEVEELHQFTYEILAGRRPDPRLLSDSHLKSQPQQGEPST